MATLEHTTLGPLQLSPHLRLRNLLSAHEITVTSRRTVGGRMTHQALPLSGGRLLELFAENHFTRAELVAIKGLERAGEWHLLVHHLGTYTVMVVGAPEEPAIDYADPDDDDWYSGSIILQER